MPRPPEELGRRLDELIERCVRFRRAVETEVLTHEGPVQFQMPAYEQWRFLLSSIQTVGAACGKESPHYREIESCRSFYLTPDGALDLDRCRGVLQAARDDLDAGMLSDMRQLVAAETFGDLLESANHLLEEGHHLPAVALAGAVLESNLRALALEKKVAWNGHSSITKINSELYKSGVYDKVLFAEIEAWARLRNKVDHGDFVTRDEIDTASARRMLDGIRHFSATHR